MDIFIDAKNGELTSHLQKSVNPGNALFFRKVSIGIIEQLIYEIVL